MSRAFLLGYDAFFLEGSDGLGANFHCYLFAINYKCFGLEVWFPYLFGVALGKADVAAKLLAFACDFALLHWFILSSQNGTFSGELYLFFIW